MNIPLVYEYLIYVAAIIVGIVLLIFLRRASKLPTHQKLQERMASHLQDMDGYVTSLREGKETGVRFFKKISKLLYTTDKLIYAASALARKERDTDIDNVSVLLEKTRNDLLPYKYGKREQYDLAGMEQAGRELRAALDVMRDVLARDEQLKARSAK